MLASAYLSDIRWQYNLYKSLADRAIDQVAGDRFFENRGQESNSVAMIMIHVTGNLRSRWTDFLTTDGQKPDRNRDSEFVRRREETRATLLEGWEASWKTVQNTLKGLEEDDLTRTVTIRAEPHVVVEAINRNLAHTAYHVGQIVQLARDIAGPRWKTLSIARGQSDSFDADMNRKFGR